jgi:RNA polymerase sigma-70 factor (ECF subfamily)
LRHDDQHARFEQLIVPHLDAAYNLARWLTRRDQDAEDVVQEACLRAYQFFGGFHDTDGRAWLLAIVRNTCYTWMQRNRQHAASTSFDEEMHGAASPALDPQAILSRTEDTQVVREALEELPDEFREVIVLRELEGLPYKDIAQIAAIPIGTVMSRLARARDRLQQILAPRVKKES